ncbi:MAG: Rpn family recombination-promoting nuclease/putative transposase [Porticoccaceae bacterium]
MDNTHDGAYKKLFSHPQMIRDLLTGFVAQSWVAELDFSTLAKLNGHYVSDDLRHRQDDLVWRVRHRGEWLYIYLLLEFQSSNDHWMALRMMVYVGLLYQDLIKSREIKRRDRLPPVFPLVIYNGMPSWTAPQRLSELISPLPGLKIFQPEQRYFVLDEGRSSARARKLPDNSVASLIELEGNSSPETMQEAVRRLRERLAGPEHASLRRAFTVWLNKVIIHKRLAKGQPIPENETLEEVESMLAERMEQWKREWERKGRAEGRAEGKQEGRTAVLARQLTLKFGTLPEPTRRRLSEASSDELDLWAERILFAENIGDVFR